MYVCVCVCIYIYMIIYDNINKCNNDDISDNHTNDNTNHDIIIFIVTIINDNYSNKIGRFARRGPRARRDGRGGISITPTLY